VGGLARGAGQPASNALIATAVAPGRRGLAYGAKQAAIPAGVLLGGLAVPVFGVTVGWRWAYVAAAVVAVVVAVVLPSTANAAPAHPAGSRGAGGLPAAAGSALGVLPRLVLGAVGTAAGCWSSP